MAVWILLPKAVLLLLLFSVLLYTVIIFSRPNEGAPSPPDDKLLCRSHPPLSKPPHNKRVVLVTGAAGFVGYHISRSLIDQWDADVIGLDSFTDYYDVQLKRDRSNELIKAGVILYRWDVCDRVLLSYLFQRYNFTDVVHMAAQAGVRHSLDQPSTYAHTNIQCFLALLDTLREFNRTSLVYASTSSVYGRTSPLPFSTDTKPQPPTNVYAASKMTNEHFSRAYCMNYDIQSTGVRLFTVYGPWGRPDMATYKFTDSIANGKPLPIFKSSQPLFRDFTFVNDTVGVILAALDHTPSCCGEVYNAGLGEPRSLETLVKYLEEEFNTTATVKSLPLLSCDLQMTWADMEATKKVLGYQPRVGLKEGLGEFVRWYRKYHRNRRVGGASERNEQLEEVLLTGEREVAGAHRMQLAIANTKYRERMGRLKETYLHFASNHGIQLPDLTKNGFIYYPGIESPGYTVIKAPGYQGNMKMLEQRCLATEQCVGFTTRGEFKNQLSPFERWTSAPNGHGMFVADMDLCASDLHSCGENAVCVYTGPGNYTCVCYHGYSKLGRYCIERYTDGAVGNTEGAWQLSDQFDGFDWEQFARGKPFVFFQGMDSPGGDYLVVEGGAGDVHVERLEEACLSTHHCLGFNTNGILKHSIRPPGEWVRWAGPRYTQHGLFVLDIDYCSLDIEQCPLHSQCQKHSPGNYSCACQQPWVTAHDNTCVQHKELIHVILSTDPDHLPGLVGVVSSTLRHASNPQRLMFHVVFIGTERTLIDSYLCCYGYVHHPQIEVILFDVSMFEESIKVYSRIEDVGNLASLGNFARFYFHSLFPDLGRAIYLDVDTVVMGDIGEVWEQLVTTDKLVLAAPRNSPTYGDLLAPKVKRLFQVRNGYVYSTSDITFNAGVYGVNFDLWRNENIHEEVKYWMGQQAKEPLWRFGTQPVLLLVAYGRWGKLDSNWNVNGLGWNHDLGIDTLRKAKLLHWSGKGKPWLDGGLYKELWAANIPAPCSGRGLCITTATNECICQCVHGYTGEQCNGPMMHNIEKL